MIVIGVLFLLLEMYFLISTFMENSENSAKSAAFLFTYSMVCFFAVFILAIVNYSKELNSKSSYLIFMTPNTSLSIILSKMFTILIIGLVSMAVILVFGYLDWKLLYNTYPDLKFLSDSINSVIIITGVNSNNFIFAVIAYLAEFVISFFSTVTLAYFAITLSATLLQNNRFKGIVSFALFFGFSYLIGLISGHLPLLIESPETLWDVFVSLIPATLFDLCIMCLCVFGCSALLDKKVSL